MKKEITLGIGTIIKEELCLSGEIEGLLPLFYLELAKKVQSSLEERCNYKVTTTIKIEEYPTLASIYEGICELEHSYLKDKIRKEINKHDN